MDDDMARPDASSRLDDPAWVDEIMARAVAQVTATAPDVEAPPEAPPGEAPKRVVRRVVRARPRPAPGPEPRAVPTSLLADLPPPPTASTVATEPAATPDAPELVDEPPQRLRRGLEWVLVIGGALVVALLIKTFLIQAFYIPSGSMIPTLEPDDRVLVNKVSYDLHDVNRGDLIVFKRPEEGAGDGVDDLIKRVIGLPNDTVEVRDSVVYVNGLPLDEPYLPEDLDFGDAPPVVVPDDEVFVMGDNRPDSRDSRVFGPVPIDDIVGRAFFRIWPPSDVGFL